jgi:hypothetical protein
VADVPLSRDDVFGKLPYCWQILEMIITLALEMESILKRIRGG